MRSVVPGWSRRERDDGDESCDEDVDAATIGATSRPSISPYAVPAVTNTPSATGQALRHRRLTW